MTSILSQEEEALLNSVMNEENTESDNTPIPENHTVNQSDVITSRFSGAQWYDYIRELCITVAGVGGIGSNFVFLLSRLNPKYIHLYDDDTVELANLSGQLFGIDDIGLKKVWAISQKVKSLSSYYSCVNNSYKFKKGDTLSNISVCGFDNMEARKIYFNTWLTKVKELSNNWQNIGSVSEFLFIDGRLNLEEFQIFAIQGDDKEAIKNYQEKWLFDDAEAEHTICSQKQTTFMSCMIASMMINILVNFAANKNGDMRPVPFYTNYNANTMYTKIEL